MERDRRIRERAQRKCPDVHAMQPTQPQTWSERTGGKGWRSTGRKAERTRRGGRCPEREEWGEAASGSTICSGGPGPGFAAFSSQPSPPATAGSAAGSEHRATCPPASPLPQAGSHPGPAQSTKRVIQAGAKTGSKLATSESSHREGSLCPRTYMG